MKDLPNLLSTLEWLARVGGRARYVCCRRFRRARNVDIFDPHMLIAPNGDICETRPTLYELMQDDWFALYDDANGYAWVSLVMRPANYAAFVKEARGVLLSAHMPR